MAPLVRSAHERHDGSGYPDGLAGIEIPCGAMIIATCDAFHAHDEAVLELRAGAGTQFDPEVVEALFAELE